MAGPAQTSEPIIVYLYRLVDAIAEGRLCIPRFQRRLVWDWDRQSELLRSVRDGIPMGAIMIWRSNGRALPVVETLYGHKLSPPSADRPREYVLDGFQRLSTLFAALHDPGTEANWETDSAADDEEPFWLGYDLETQQFIRTSTTEKAPPQVIPLSVLGDGVRLLRFQRKLTGPHTEEWIDRADELARAFREYKIPQIPIETDDFQTAARTFKLINTRGVLMGEADMVHALTWSEKFEFRERIEVLRQEQLQPLGWGEIDFENILKIIKLRADLDIYEASAEDVSAVLRPDPSRIEDSIRATAVVAHLLADQCGIFAWALVPYSLQIVCMAAVIDESNDAMRASFLRDWFWMTTYGELFAGLSGSRFSIVVQNLRKTLTAQRLEWPGAKPFQVRPLPATADFRSVRTRTLAFQLAWAQRGAGFTIPDPFRVLAAEKRDALFPLVPRKHVDKAPYASPGNRFLCHPSLIGALREKLLSGAIDDSLAAAHLLSPAAVAAAKAGRWDEFIHERTVEIERAENAFLDELRARHPSAF